MWVLTISLSEVHLQGSISGTITQESNSFTISCLALLHPNPPSLQKRISSHLDCNEKPCVIFLSTTFIKKPWFSTSASCEASNWIVLNLALCPASCMQDWGNQTFHQTLEIQAWWNQTKLLVGGLLQWDEGFFKDEGAGSAHKGS